MRRIRMNAVRLGLGVIIVLLLGVSSLSAQAAWYPVGSGVNDIVRAAVEYNGDLIVGGDFITAGGGAAPFIARWDGSSWSPLGIGTNGAIYALAVYNGDLYAGGVFTTAGGVGVSNIARWNGSTWSALGSGIAGAVFALAAYNGSLYVGGNFGIAGGATAYNIARLNGSTWSSVGSATGTNSNIWSLTVYGGRLIAGGGFSIAGGVSANKIAAWNGSSWSPLGSGLNGLPLALTTWNGSLVAGGQFTQAGGTPVNRLARWNGSSWAALGSGITGGNLLALSTYNGNLIAGGTFNVAGGSPASYIAQWNGGSWSSLGSGVNSAVQSLANSGGALIVGGWFTAAGGQPASRVAQWSNNTLTLLDAHMTPIANKVMTLSRVVTPFINETSMGTVTTNSNGQFTFPAGFSIGDQIKTWVELYEYPTRYAIELDNGKFDLTTGALSYDVLTGGAQTLILDHTVFAIDLTVSLFWDVDDDPTPGASNVFMQEFAFGLNQTANYLYDVFDGQTRIRNVTIYDDAEHWKWADIRVVADNRLWPHAGLKAYLSNRKWAYVAMPPKWFGGSVSTADGTYNEYPLDLSSPAGGASNFKTIAHELGHYYYGFGDEYRDRKRRLIRPRHDPSFGFMDSHVDSDQASRSEMSRTSVEYSTGSSRNTHHFSIRRMGCFNFFEDLKEATYSGVYAEVYLPHERGIASPGYMLGPNDSDPVMVVNVDVGWSMNVTFVDNDHHETNTRRIEVQDAAGAPVEYATVWITKSRRSDIVTGLCNRNGRIRLLGFDPLLDVVRSQRRTSPVSIPKAAGGGKSASSDAWFSGEFFTEGSIGDTLVMAQLQGDYPAIISGTYSGSGLTFDFSTANSMPTTPTLEMDSWDEGKQSYSMSPTGSGYSAWIPNPIGDEGNHTLYVVDDVGKQHFIQTSYVLYEDYEFLPDAGMFGPGGATEVIFDTTIFGSNSLFILQSEYPVIRTGLDPLAVQAGYATSVDFSGGQPLPIGTHLNLRYNDSDLGDSADVAELESGLQMYQYDQADAVWILLASTMDTAHNSVNAEITESGVYALFTVGSCQLCCDMPGDIDLDGLAYKVADAVQFSNFFVYQDTSYLPCIGNADVNADCVVGIEDLIYMIRVIQEIEPPLSVCGGCSEMTACLDSACTEPIDIFCSGVTSECLGIRGNVDGDPEDEINVSDLTYLVDYLFLGGPEPPWVEEGNVDGVTGPGGSTDVSDLTYLVAYLFTGGSEPPSCDWSSDPPAAGKMSSDVILRSTYENNVTTVSIESAVDLRGLQIDMVGTSSGEPIQVADSDLELFFHQKGNSVRVGMLDLEGIKTIPRGEQVLFRVQGKLELLTAIVSDMDHHGSIPGINVASKNSALPEKFALGQNYPNPFNPTTEINFTLPQAGHARLKVYNITGQQVATLVNRHMEAGTHSVSWDSRSNNGQPVSSGVYFYRLEAGDNVSTKKMVLLK